MYDVIIIGAGPAGLFAAYELSKQNLKIAVIEKGSGIDNRKKNVMSGVGGAGLYSDGKLNLTPRHGKTNLYEFLSVKKAIMLINYVDKILMDFGAPKESYTKHKEKALGIKKKAIKNNIDLLLIKQKHLGSDKLKPLIDKFVTHLKMNNVEFILNTEVNEIITKNNNFVGVKTNKKLIKAKYLIAAPGRIGSKWITEQANKLKIPLKHRGIEVGVRVEVPAKVMRHITDHIWDPAFILRSRITKDIVRTFCTCPYGFVSKETYHGFICVNGHCEIKRKSKNTNFALLTNIELTEPAEDTIAYGESIGKLATTIAGGKPFIQRLEDLKHNRRSYWHRINKSRIKPTLKEVTPGDLSMAIPHRIVNNILDALDQLEKIIPNLTKDMLIYGPELKFFSVKIATNKNLETKIKNLFVAGDGVGLAGNIVGAAATGIIAARGIIKKAEKLGMGKLQ